MGAQGPVKAGIVLQGQGASDYYGVGIGLSRNWRGKKGFGFAGEVKAAVSTEGQG